MNPSPTGLLSAIRGFQIFFSHAYLQVLSPKGLYESITAYDFVHKSCKNSRLPRRLYLILSQLNIICSIILILGPRSQSPKKKLFCFGASLAIVGILCKRQTTLVSWHNLSHPAVPSVKVFLRPHVKLYNGEFAKRKKFTSVRNLLSKVCKFLQRMLSRTDMG